MHSNHNIALHAFHKVETNDATFARSVVWQCNRRENGKHLLNCLADPLLPFIWCIGRVVWECLR